MLSYFIPGILWTFIGFLGTKLSHSPTSNMWIYFKWGRCSNLEYFGLNHQYLPLEDKIEIPLELLLQHLFSCSYTQDLFKLQVSNGASNASADQDLSVSLLFHILHFRLHMCSSSPGLFPELDEAGWWCTLWKWVCIFVMGSSPIKSHPKNECKQTEHWLLPFTAGNKSRTLRSSLRLNIQQRVSSSCLWLSHRSLTAPDLHLILQCEGNISCCNHTRTLRWFSRAVFQIGK